MRRELTTEQIMHYVPKSKKAAVSDAFADCDGMWIYLHDGWDASRMDIGYHVIHADCVKELRYQIGGIRKD